MAVTYPYGYGTGRMTMAQLRARYEPRMHPEYARRLFAWLESYGGKFGIGGGWRDTQPDKPGFAPDGQSFHQTQNFRSGFSGYCAVDLVVGTTGKHRAPFWSEVPAQGTPAAIPWGLHCNVGTPPRGEPWHIQPIEIDGWQSWVNAGRPDPQAGYKLPSDPAPPIPPDPTFNWKEPAVALHMLDPKVRLIDTRSGFGALPKGKVLPGKPVKVPIPAEHNPLAAIVNVTVVQPSGPGHLAIAGEFFGSASDGNFSQADASPEACPSIAAVVGSGSDRYIQVRLAGSSAHLVVDLMGVVS